MPAVLQLPHRSPTNRSHAITGESHGKKFPSLAALLGLVAIAGYQNREKIGEFVKGIAGADPRRRGRHDRQREEEVVTGEKDIKGGLGELVDQFKKNGAGDAVESWVGTGPNAPMSETQMEKSLGGDLIDSSSSRPASRATNFSRASPRPCPRPSIR